MAQLVTLFTNSLVNLLYPLRCANCGKCLGGSDGPHLCGPCRDGIRQNPKPHCESCGRPVDKTGRVCAECRKRKPHFTMARAAYLYDGPLKEVIHAFKYKRRISLSEMLTDLMLRFVQEDRGILENIDAITFVPLDAGRLRQRGFNQSKTLAYTLSKALAIPLSEALEKIARTRHQNELSRDERLSNLNGAFKVSGMADVKGLKILLIDDVMTTGATLDECSRALLEAGAKEVRCLALARGI